MNVKTKILLIPLTATFVVSSLSLSFISSASASETVSIQKGKNVEEQIDNLSYSEIEELSEEEMAEDSAEDVTIQSKGSIAIKQASKYLKDNTKKVDGWIDSAIDKLPVGSERKKTWKAAISVYSIAVVMDHYVGFVDSVEEAMTNAIVDTTPIPRWAANAIAKTVTLFLPI
ncbi:hypothetical protein [Alteribacillus bidgolensis]|uniref:Secreted protein n=1 Tax=Alteribacillus bidgolensis TaxID=930129 RepID=A0A1G8JKL0_9BACI|nr:hypothetical protein [Alteribacillus bidgolensis]SDI31758.1 hypothetical protein SAMN05216352_106235 [Alteribacillus bidgolensis]